MSHIFHIVANILNIVANKTGISYEEINIIFYYLIIPFSYIILIDMILGKHYLKVLYFIIATLIFIFVKNLNEYSTLLFKDSTNFLDSFSFIGLDYNSTSVIICVIIPYLLYPLFIILFVIKKTNKEQ